MDHLTIRERVAIAKRSPARISITVSYQLHQQLVDRSIDQGRSISNLCAYLLETAMPVEH
jgi:hypothetical protein